MYGRFWVKVKIFCSVLMFQKILLVTSEGPNLIFPVACMCIDDFVYTIDSYITKTALIIRQKCNQIQQGGDNLDGIDWIIVQLEFLHLFNHVTQLI